jgi:hypothetical protein
MKFWVLVSGLLLVACVGSRDHDGGTSTEQDAGAPLDAKDAAACQDSDGDGYGEGCERGGDCNDADQKIHSGCSECAYPEEGCGCGESSKPVSCYLTPSADDNGTLMCHEGTRYCREGQWSGCEAIVSYPKPELTQPQAIIAVDAGPTKCSDCAVNCFLVRDHLDPVDAGFDGSATNTQIGDGGGITLQYTNPDAATMDAGSTFDPSTCVLGTAPDHDCDGIPDTYDPYPNDKPFATANPTIFLDIAPGQTGVGVVKLAFYLNSADVYFLVDQTGSMAGERDQLKADLVSGDFINNAGFNCADYDFDFQPNNELKAQGIVGAIRCIIRDANFGVGYFRELPFQNATFSPSFYAATDSVTYRNLQDITGSVNAVTSAVGKLTTVGNIDWAEASMVALNSVVTGNGMYLGVDRPGVPTRGGCPSLAWGYPCFRSNAIPIVLMFTDAPFHNGPATGTAPAIPNDPYNSAYLGITKGSSTSYSSITPTNEAYASAVDLGDLTSKYYSYIGDTTSMTSDLLHSASTCTASGSQDSPDALFKFTLTATKTLVANTLGSDFDTTLALYRGTTVPPTNLAAYPNTNDTGAAPYSFGAAANKYVKAAGNSSTLASDFSSNDISCGAVPGAKDATFTFSLAASTKVALDTAGSSYGTVLGLFSGTPTTTSYTTIADTNDTLATAYSVGTLNTKNLGFAGNTSAAGITANYTNTQLACAAAPADASPEAVYSFVLSSSTKVRLSAEDAALNTVLMLTDNGGKYLAPTAITNTNENEATAYNIGALDGQAYQYTGNTAAMAADYPSTLVACNSGDAAKDAVYKFTLAATKTVTIDTVGTNNYDTVLGLFRSNVTEPNTYQTVMSGNPNERGNVAHNIGTVNGKKYIISGGDTTSMAADYNSTQIGCSTQNNNSPEAVFKFHLDTSTKVRVDTSSTTSGFDTLISLHGGTLGPLPDLIQSTSNNLNEAAGSAPTVAPLTSAPNLRFLGNTTSMGTDVLVDNTSGCSALGKDAVYKLNIASAGDYVIDTVGTTAFDTVLGLYPSTIYNPTPPTPSPQGANGDKKTSGTTSLKAIDVGALDGRWVSYTGNTSTLAADSNSSFTNCSVVSGSKDAYYKFTLTNPATVSIDTVGSTAFDTVIGLYNWTTDAQIGCNNGAAGGFADRYTTTGPLAAGTYYVIVKGRGTTSSGAYTITFRDTAVSTTTNLVSCDNDGGGGTTSKITATLSVGTYYVIVKGRTTTDKGAYTLSIKRQDWIDAANRLYCDDNGGSGSYSQIEQTLAAGDYWVVVKGYRDSRKGSYVLTVQDINTPPVVAEVACDDDTSGSTSSITQSLSAGTYYVVVKGSGTASGPYMLTVRDTAVSLVNNLACDNVSGPGGKAFIEQTLAAGTYRVIVKGKAASDKGPYRLILRDVTSLPTKRLACDHNSGSGGKAYLESTLGAGTYTVVLSGDSSSAAGAYNLSLRDANNIAVMDTPLACNNDYTSGEITSAVSTSLAAGTYYAAIKGYHTADVGTYQLNIGAGTTSAATYTPPTWAQTLAALQAKQVRVLPVISCHDDPYHGDKYLGLPSDCITTRTQATALANATGALGSNLAPLVFDIDGDGGGLSKTVVDGVAALAHYLEMNVQARVVFSPDANPGFGLVVKAVDSPTDGCSGIFGTPTPYEHQHCVPGASPRFELAFTNPLPGVPLNPADPNGGYNFRAELIGDNQFVVDKVPIYIIPRIVVTAPPPVPQVVASGSYWQDITAPGCQANQRPDWHDLKWSANVPNGTSVSFNVCASDKAPDLQTCPLTPLCTVTGGGPCTTNAQCPNGYCSKVPIPPDTTPGNCQTITAGACSTDAQCLSGSHCRASKCTFDVQPVYIGGVLGSSNYAANLRMNIGLRANVSANTTPTVYDWSLTYVCNNTL